MSNINNYEEHIVAFIDLLGFKDAVNANRQVEILKLLQLFIKLRNEESKINSIKFEKQETYNISPAISVFSDNIVISLPVKNELPNHVEFGTFFAMARCIELIAAKALEKGFLIRGGIAQGNLYHQGGIIFGDALLEAIKLESSVAVYPRVLISAEVLKSHKTAKMPRYHVIDYDGLSMLHYGPGLFIEGIMGIPQSEEYKLNLKNRISDYDTIITNNLKALETNLRVYSKWAWFSRYYEKIKTGYRPDLRT